MVGRVVLFVDYQNMYRGVREVFHRPSDPPRAGQIDPLQLGQLIVEKSPFPRDLAQIRVYRGRPDATKDPRTYAANLRQSVAQELSGQGKVTVIARPLRYPPDWPVRAAKEKGIDVALAVDFVMMAVRHEYDVGVIMSTDTDLVPALEAVVSLGGNPRCEVVAWTNPRAGHSRRIGVRGARVWCHWLNAQDYEAVTDLTDYNVAPA